jgi:hypothetical protein
MQVPAQRVAARFLAAALHWVRKDKDGHFGWQKGVFRFEAEVPKGRYVVEGSGFEQGLEDISRWYAHYIIPDEIPKRSFFINDVGKALKRPRSGTSFSSYTEAMAAAEKHLARELSGPDLSDPHAVAKVLTSKQKEFIKTVVEFGGVSDAYPDHGMASERGFRIWRENMVSKLERLGVLSPGYDRLTQLGVEVARLI